MMQATLILLITAFVGFSVMATSVSAKTKVSSDPRKITAREKAKTERRAAIFRGLDSSDDLSALNKQDSVPTNGQLISSEDIDVLATSQSIDKKIEFIEKIHPERLSISSILSLSRWKAHESSDRVKVWLDLVLKSPDVFRMLETEVFESTSSIDTQIAAVTILENFSNLSAARVLAELRAETKHASVREACDASLQRMGGAPRFREPMLQGTPVRLRW